MIVDLFTKKRQCKHVLKCHKNSCLSQTFTDHCHILSQNSQNVITCHRISGKQVLSQKVTMSQGITSLKYVTNGIKDFVK